MAQGCDLPQELIDAIIDFLHDDPRSLQSCALVARAWRACSQFHYFHTVEVSEDQIMTTFMQQLDGNVALGANICALQLMPQPHKRCGIVPRTLAALLQRLPSLHTLALWGVRVGPFDDGLQLRVEHPKLRSLELSMCSQSAADAVRTMALFAGITIDTLRIDNSEYTDLLEVDYSTLAALFDERWNVGSLVLGHNSFHTFRVLFELFRRVSAPGTLHSLDVPQSSLMKIPEIFSAFLTHVGPTLQGLRWDVTTLYNHVSPGHWPILLQCTSLQTLHLYLQEPYHRVITDMDTLTALFPAHILQYAPPSLHVITLAFGDASFMHHWFTCVDWKALEQVLLEFPRLKEVRIILEDPFPDFTVAHLTFAVNPEDQMHITSALPNLQSKGVLRFPGVKEELVPDTTL